MPSNTTSEPPYTPTVAADVSSEMSTPIEPASVVASPDAPMVEQATHGNAGPQPDAAADGLTRKAMVFVQWMSPAHNDM